MTITPGNAIFALLSFEGPDPYSQAGGLGTRMHNLAQSLAEMGFETHLFFVGDPYLPGEESIVDGRYVFHRWCQWLSRHHSNGVYDHENAKVADYTRSVPPYVCDVLGRKAAREGKLLIVMAEEWHTVEALCNISDLLHWNHIRDKAVLLWNANNTMSFRKIDFQRLKFVGAITAVSKFMKQIMWNYGTNAIVVPNGIPVRMFKPHNKEQVKKIKAALKLLPGDLKVLKIGRFDPAKRWMMAVEAVARMKRAGIPTTFFVRGGLEPHGGEVLGHAARIGLSIADIYCDEKRPSVERCIDLIASAPHADILNLKFFLPEEFVNLLYHACDCVFANSGFEPFGLVGLEVMAAGGLAFTGATGEDYVIPFVNAITVETDDPNEIVTYLNYLNKNPKKRDEIKRAAYKTAEQFAWPVVIENLLRRIEFLAMK